MKTALRSAVTLVIMAAALCPFGSADNLPSPPGGYVNLAMGPVGWGSLSPNGSLPFGGFFTPIIPASGYSMNDWTAQFYTSQANGLSTLSYVYLTSSSYDGSIPPTATFNVGDKVTVTIYYKNYWVAGRVVGTYPGYATVQGY